MSEDRVTLETELKDYADNIDSWISAIAETPVDVSKKGVVERFVRDCQTLKADLYTSNSPSNEDLNDFTDRHASLDVQYNNLKTHLK